MRPYGQYCPIAKAAEVLGDRWTLLILRDMHTGALRFNDLHRGLPGISRSVLVQRLRQLERDGLIARTLDDRNRTSGYVLTDSGRDLDVVLTALTDWVNRWVMDDPSPAEADPRILMLWFSRVADVSPLKGGRLVVEFELQGPRPGRSWLVIEAGEVSLCLEDPCVDIDLFVTADTSALYEVFMRRRSMSSAAASGLVSIQGSSHLARSFLRVVDETRLPYLIGPNPVRQHQDVAAADS